MKKTQPQTCQVIINVQSVRIEPPVQAIYYLQYKLGDSKVAEIGSSLKNNNNQIQFNEAKMITFTINHQNIDKMQLQISLFIQNDANNQNQRKRDQLAGRLLLSIANIFQDKYKDMQQVPFQISSFNSFIKFACTSAQPYNLSSHTNLQRKDVSVAQNSFSPPSQQNLSNSSKKSSNEKSWEQLLVHQASFFSQHHILAKIDTSQALQERIKQMQKVDLQVLLKDNYRLQRLLYIARNQRKIESSRHQQQLKDMARQLSLKEAETIRLKEDLQNVRERVGQLLDQCDILTKEKEEFEIVVQNQKSTNIKLQQSYQTLSNKVKQLCLQDQTNVVLREQLQAATQLKLELQQQIEELKLVENTLSYQKQQLQNILRKSQQNCKHLQQQLKNKQEIANMCQQRLTDLQQKIDQLQGVQEYEEQIHHTSYTAYDHSKSAKIRIEDEDTCSLNRIIEEDLEESLPIEDNVKTSQEYFKTSNQIFTSTTLVEHSRNNSELQLLQLLTRNLQRDYDELKKLYREQETIITYKHMQLQGLQKSLAQMRYQFLLQLSRVTAMMNQQILQNRGLKEQNYKLQTQFEQYKSQQTVINHQATNNKSKQFTHYNTTHSSYAHQRMLFDSERDEYLKRCKKLQQDNHVLLKFNLQREELYQMMMSRRHEGDHLIVDHFENSIKYIIQHREKYGSLLQAYGFNQELMQVRKTQGESNISQIINNFPINTLNHFESSSQVNKLESQSQGNQLLIESTARAPIFKQQNSIKMVLSELVELYKDRITIGQGRFKRDKQKQDDKQELIKRIKSEMNKLKIVLLRQIKSNSRSHLLSPLCSLQQDIDQFCSI